MKASLTYTAGYERMTVAATVTFPSVAKSTNSCITSELSVMTEKKTNKFGRKCK